MRISVQDISFDVAPGKNEAFWKSVSADSWERETFDLFRRFLDSDHCYIDIGAWIGPTVLFGGQLAKLTFAVEPDPIAFEELKQNIALNGSLAERIRVCNVCVATSSGQVAFGNRGVGGDSTSSLLFGGEKTHWTAKALTFEDFVRTNDVRDCNFIKMDIEGGEYQVIPTMRQFLRTNRPTLHLSLHPCYLKSPLGAAGVMFVRIWETLKLMRCLGFYRHVYDHKGRKFSWSRLLRLSRAKITFDVVLTDKEWDAASVEPTSC